MGEQNFRGIFGITARCRGGVMLSIKQGSEFETEVVAPHLGHVSNFRGLNEHCDRTRGRVLFSE